MTHLCFHYLWILLLKVCLAQKWKVSVYQNEFKDAVRVITGVFTQIDIRFEKNAQESPSHIKGSLILSDTALYHLSTNEILFDTSSSLIYKTLIGITCNADPSQAEKPITLSVIAKDLTPKMDSTPFKIQYSVNPTPRSIQLTLSNHYVSFGTPESFSQTDILFNVDPLTIAFTPKATNSKYGFADSIVINQFPFPSDSKGNYGFSQFDYIVYQQEFEPIIDSKCFTISNKVLFSLSQQSLKELNAKVKEELEKTQLIPSSTDNTVKFNVQIKVVPSILSCAVFTVPTVKLSDTDIRNKQQKGYPAKDLQYYQQFFNTKPIEGLIAVPQFKGLSRLLQMRMKCILDSNEEISQTKDNFRSSSIVFGKTKLADIKEQVYGNMYSLITTNCCNWNFIKAISKEPFQSKAVDFCNGLLKSDLGCTKCEFRVNPNEKVASICVVPEETCSTNYKGRMDQDFKAFTEKISTGKGIKDNLGLDEQEYSVSSIQIESDYFSIEESTVTSIIKEKSESKVILEITNKNKWPIECYPRLINKDSYLDIYNEEFLNETMKGVINAEGMSTFTVFYQSVGLQQSMYNIYLNCLNLPNFQHYFDANYQIISSFYLPFIPLPKPTREPLPECKNDMKKPHCKKTSKVFPSSIENILVEMDEYKTFRRLTQYEQLNVIYETRLSLDAKSKEDLLHLALMFDQMTHFDCLAYSNYTECRKIKTYSTTVIYKNIRLKYSRVFETEAMSDLRYYYSFVLYYMSLNSDTFDQEIGNEFIDVVFMSINKYGTIMKDDSKILLLFGGIVNNLIDYLDYMYIDGFLTGGPTSEETQMYTNSTLRKNLKFHIEDMVKLFREVGLTASYSNFIYTHHRLSKESPSETEFINVGYQPINVTISSKELILIKKASYLSSIIYLNYPLRGYNNSKVWDEVISLKAYDENNTLVNVSDLKTRIKIRYNKLRTNNTHLLYCGYLDEDFWDIESYGMVSSEYETKALICETNHLTDFIVKDTNVISYTYLWWLLPLCAFALLAISLGGYFLIKKYMKNKQITKESVISSTESNDDNRLIER